MSEKSLPDELRSVLLAHSFDAPDPEDTVSRTLAATVDADALSSSPSSAPRRWRPSAGLVGGVAAGVVLVALGGGLVALTRNSHEARSGSAAAGVAQFPAESSNGSDKMAPRSPNAVGPESSRTSSVRIPNVLNCTGTGVSSFSQTVPLDGGQDQVVNAQCVNATGDRQAGTVYTTRVADGAAQLQATLIRPSDGLSVQSVSTGPSEITVRFLRLATDRTPQALEQKTFQTVDGGYSYHTVQAVTVAQDCAPDRLSATVVAGSSVLAAVLQVTSTDTSACLLTGYPAIGSSTRALRGAAGGTAQSTVPIVLLQPGQTASAAIDQPRSTMPCATDLGLRSIQLPDGAPLLDVTFHAALGCVLQVHPFVPGDTGSG